MSLSPCPPSVHPLCAQLKPFYPYIAPGLTVHTAQNRDWRSSTSPLVPLCWAFAAAAMGFYWRVVSRIETSFQSIQHGAIEAHSVFWGTVVPFSLCSWPMLEVNWCLTLESEWKVLVLVCGGPEKRDVGKMWQSSMSRCHIWTSLWSTSFVCEVCPWSLVSIFEDKWVQHLLLEVETFVIISLLCLTAICLWVFKKKLQLPWIFPQRKLKYETLQLFLSYSLYPSTPSSSSCCLCCKHLFFLKELFNILGSVLFHFLELDEKIIAFLMCAC